MQDCGALCKTILLHFSSRYASIQIIYFNFFFALENPSRLMIITQSFTNLLGISDPKCDVLADFYL